MLLLNFSIFQEKRRLDRVFYTLPRKSPNNQLPGNQRSRCFRHVESILPSFLRTPDSVIPRRRNQLCFSSALVPPTTLAEVSCMFSGGCGSVKSSQFPAPVSLPPGKSGWFQVRASSGLRSRGLGTARRVWLY